MLMLKILLGLLSLKKYADENRIINIHGLAPSYGASRAKLQIGWALVPKPLVEIWWKPEK